MGNVFFKEEALFVGWTFDGQYMPTHLDFDCNLQFDASKVTRSLIELRGKCSIPLAQCKGEQQLNLIAEVVVIH
jgi:hypothetical protein